MGNEPNHDRAHGWGGGEGTFHVGVEQHGVLKVYLRSRPTRAFVASRLQPGMPRSSPRQKMTQHASRTMLSSLFSQRPIRACGERGFAHRRERHGERWKNRGQSPIFATAPLSIATECSRGSRPSRARDRRPALLIRHSCGSGNFDVHDPHGDFVMFDAGGDLRSNEWRGQESVPQRGGTSTTNDTNHMNLSCDMVS